MVQMFDQLQSRGLIFIASFLLILMAGNNCFATKEDVFIARWEPYPSVRDSYTISTTIIPEESLSGYTHYSLIDILRTARFSVINHIHISHPDSLWNKNDTTILINGISVNDSALNIHWEDIPVYYIQQIEIITGPPVDSSTQMYSLVNIFVKRDICPDLLSCFTEENDNMYRKTSQQNKDMNVENLVLGTTFHFPVHSILNTLFEGYEIGHPESLLALNAEDKGFFIKVKGEYDLSFVREDSDNGKRFLSPEESFDPEQGFYIGMVDGHDIYLKGKAYSGEDRTEDILTGRDASRDNNTEPSNPYLSGDVPINYEVGVKIEKNKNYSVEFIGFQNNQNTKSNGVKAKPHSEQQLKGSETVTIAQGVELNWSLVLSQWTLRGEHTYKDKVRGFAGDTTAVISDMVKQRNSIGVDYSISPKWVVGGEMTYHDYYETLQPIGFGESSPKLGIHAYHYPTESKSTVLELSINNITESTDNTSVTREPEKVIWAGVNFKF